MGLFRASVNTPIVNEHYKWLKIPSGRRQSIWLFTSVAEEFYSGLPQTTPANGQKRTWTHDLQISSLALWSLGHTASTDRLWLAICFMLAVTCYLQPIRVTFSLWPIPTPDLHLWPIVCHLCALQPTLYACLLLPVTCSWDLHIGCNLPPTTCSVRHLTSNLWFMKYDMWHAMTATCDLWNMTCDMTCLVYQSSNLDRIPEIFFVPSELYCIVL